MCNCSTRRSAAAWRWISNGLYKQARRQAATNLQSIRTSVKGRDLDLITTSSTCTFTLRDEYPHLLGLENGDVRDRIELATRYLYRLIQSGKARLKFKETAPAARRPTTRRATWRRWAGATIRSSCCGSIPGVEVTVLDSPVLAASGGTYGFKKENYGVSQAIGAPLFRQIEESGADIVATDLRDLQMADRDVDLEALRTPAAHLGFATGVAGPFRGTESDLPCLPKNLLDELKNRGLADDALQHQHAGVGTRNCRTSSPPDPCGGREMRKTGRYQTFRFFRGVCDFWAVCGMGNGGSEFPVFHFQFSTFRTCSTQARTSASPARFNSRPGRHAAWG